MIINKNSMINIVLPDNPTKPETFAAEELSKYLKLIFGISANLSYEFKSEFYNFIIGSPNKNKAALKFLSATEFENIISGQEGIYLSARNNNILITGSEDDDGYNRGCLYAVYEFLERYLGCCFGAYTASNVNAGEIVPKYKEYEIKNFVYIKSSADLPYRTAIVQYDFWVGNADHKLNTQFIDWLAKNRYNRILTWVGIYKQYCDLELIPELEKRGIRLSVGHHQSAATWLPPYGNEYFEKKYVETNPEFYRLEKDGIRFIPKNDNTYLGQLIFCNRNQKLIEEISKNIVLWAKQNPIVDTIAFWPNDNEERDPSCCCEECSKHSKTENYLYLENEVAKLVSKELPYLKIDVLVYKDLWVCPENIQLCDNIVIDESTWGIGDSDFSGLRACGKPDGSCLIGTDFEKNLLKYKDKCENLVFYEYYMGNYGNKQRIMPSADELQSIFKHFVTVGISGSGTQMECFNHWNNLLNFYCFARTAYDTSLSLNDHLNNISLLFGEGKDAISEIFKTYENTIDGQVPIDKTGDFFVQNIDKEKIYSLFEQALDATENPTCRNNIKLLRMAFRYSVLFTEDKENDELKFIFTHYNSYLSGGGYGIAIPDQVKTDIAYFNDRWYNFA